MCCGRRLSRWPRRRLPEHAQAVSTRSSCCGTTDVERQAGGLLNKDVDTLLGYNRSMPIFEYLCQDCGREFETFVTGDRKPACPGCQGANLGKLLSRPEWSAPARARQRIAATVVRRLRRRRRRVCVPDRLELVRDRDSSACGPSAARSRRARASGGGAPRALRNADRASGVPGSSVCILQCAWGPTPKRSRAARRASLGPQALVLVFPHLCTHAKKSKRSPTR